MEFTLMRSRHLVPSVVVACAFVAALAFGPLATPALAQGVIYACVLNNANNSAVRLVGANQACRPNETLVQWNIAGATGAPGPQGDTGATGATGLRGETGAISSGISVCVLPGGWPFSE